jgi:hypothetical protein
MPPWSNGVIRGSETSFLDSLSQHLPYEVTHHLYRSWIRNLARIRGHNTMLGSDRPDDLGDFRRGNYRLDSSKRKDNILLQEGTQL